METMSHPALLMMQYLVSKKYLEIDPLAWIPNTNSHLTSL